MPKRNNFFSNNWKILILVSIVLITLIGASLYYMRSPQSNIPTAEAYVGDFIDSVTLRCEAKAQKSVVLKAPSRAGDLQIIKLVKSGTRVKKGEVVVEFDTSILQRTLDQRKAELRQAEAEIEKILAQGHMAEEQNKTEALQVNYNIERAKLETSKQEIISRVEGEKNKLLLVNTEQKANELLEKTKSIKIGNNADVEARKQQLAKKLYDYKEAEGNISMMVLRAPCDGMVTLLSNYHAEYYGSAAPDWKVGDRAYSSASMAEIPDLSSLRMFSRIDETDRGKISVGNKVKVKIDALPDKEFIGQVAEVSLLAKPDYSIYPLVKYFNVTIQLNEIDSRLRPGMSANGRVEVERISNTLLIPSEALFQMNARTFVFVASGNNFYERTVEVSRRGNGQVSILKGLRVGEKVALKNPKMNGEATSK